MKTIKQLMIAMLLLVSMEGFGQYVQVQDSNFGYWLYQNYPSCITGTWPSYQLDTTCPAMLATTSLLNGTLGVPYEMIYFKNLDSLDISSMVFSVMPPLPSSIRYLGGGLQVDSFASFPSSLRWLNLNNAGSAISRFPAFPDSLVGIYLSHMVMGSPLPAPPHSLRYMNLQGYIYQGNTTFSFPSLAGTSLDTLILDQCNIQSYNIFPALPPTLKYFSLTDVDGILYYPPFPDSVNYLMLDATNSTISMADVPASVTYFYCNSILDCIGHIYSDQLQTFEITGSQLQCMPNRFTLPSNYDINPDSLPLCAGFCSGPAGPDQTICLNTIVNISAGTADSAYWSVVPNNPATTVITDPMGANVTVSGFTQPGIYQFVLHYHSVLTDTMAVNVLPTGTPAASVSASIYPVPAGSHIIDSFSATSVYGGAQPAYNWYLDGLYLGSGDTLAEYGSAFQYGDSIWAVMISSYQCPSVDTVISNKIYIDSNTLSSNDSVWPGDADANHIVDNNDLLPIGLGYDSTGPARAQPAQGIVWQADAATDWSDSFSIYAPAVNFKNADCNGDGLINAADTDAIMANYSLTHAKSAGTSGPWRSGIPALKAIVTPDTLYNGDTMTVTFVLGDSANVVSNFYALAFTYNFNPLVIDSSFTSMNFSANSWIGNDSQKIAIRKVFSDGSIQAAVTRINHVPVSGYGAIASAAFKITTDNISGKTFSYYNNIGFLSGVTMIDQTGAILPLNAGADTNAVGFIFDGIHSISGSSLRVQPNPAHDQVMVTAGDVIQQLTMSDVAGQVVMDHSGSGSKTANLEISGYAAGIYILHVGTLNGNSAVKLVIER